MFAKHGARIAASGRQITRTSGGRRYVLTAAEQKNLSSPLAQVDNEMHDIIERERKRQRESVTLIPSENFTSKAVMDALGSEMQNKYSEGYPGARYYGGNEFIDQAERLCQKRALELFKLDSEQWGVNVQPLSGAPANLYAYSAVCQVGDRIMGLDLPHGGHLSHGYQTPTKKISFISKYFQTMPYRLDAKTELIDYDDLAHTSSLFRPKVIVAGASAYSRFIDYERMRKISKDVGAYLLTDMAHVSGLVAAGVHPSPFPYSDIVTTTTHKSLRGPRGALIFYRKGIQKITKKGTEIKYNLDQTVNFSVFPGHQGGPHNHTISALAVALGQAARPDFVDYQKKVVSNAAILANALLERGFRLVSGGTDNHLILIDVLKSKGVNGSQAEKVLELINIAANKNTVPGDTSALVPGGLRVGTPAMTTRGFEDAEFQKVAEYIDKAVEIAKRHASSGSGKVTPEFVQAVQNDPETSNLRNEIVSWVSEFSTP